MFMKLIHYLSSNGKDIFQEWLDSLRDMSARVSILRRLDRLASGNFGDCKACGNSVSELRINVGQGYRVYYSRMDKVIILLLCGGDKSTQRKDIETAIGYLNDFKRREAFEYE